jgi:hypothetical protein
MRENFIAPTIELNQEGINICLTVPLHKEHHAFGMPMLDAEECFPVIRRVNAL